MSNDNQASDGEKTGGQTNSRHDSMSFKLLHLNVVEDFKPTKVGLSQWTKH